MAFFTTAIFLSLLLITRVAAAVPAPATTGLVRRGDLRARLLGLERPLIAGQEKGGSAPKAPLPLSRLTDKITQTWPGNVQLTVMAADDYFATINHYGPHAHIELRSHF